MTFLEFVDNHIFFCFVIACVTGLTISSVVDSIFGGRR